MGTRLPIHTVLFTLVVWHLVIMQGTRAYVEQLYLSSGNTTASTIVAQPTKAIIKKISFPNLPQSKLHPNFFLCIPGSIGNLQITQQ